MLLRPDVNNYKHTKRSMENNPNIPLDIQWEIIKRLPIKSLLRFRSVSKSWKSFIQSFRYYHQSQRLLVRYSDDTYATKYASVLDDDDDHGMFSLTAPMYANLHYKPIVIGGSQGLFCIYDSTTKTAVIWNPTIRKSVDIVVPNVLDVSPYKTICGFGVCPQTCDPKLLKILILESIDYYIQKHISQRVEVFTLSSGSWTSLAYNNLPRESIWFTTNQVDIDSFIYWCAFDRFYLHGCRSLRQKNMIMSFDLTSNEFTELYLPDTLSDYHETSFKISKLKESLVVLEWKRMAAAERVYGVWMMMENGNPKSFTKLYTIDSPDGSSSISEVHGFSKSGKPILIVTKKYSSQPDSLSLYEPNTKDINTTGIPCKHGICFAISYKETLLLLDHNQPSPTYTSTMSSSEEEEEKEKEKEKQIWVWTSDGLSEIPEIAAIQCTCIRRMLRDDMTDDPFGALRLEGISLSQLNNVLEYCMHHYRNPDEDLKAWDHDFLQPHLLSLSKFQHLFKAARYLGVDSLADLLFQGYNSMVKDSKRIRWRCIR